MNEDMQAVRYFEPMLPLVPLTVFTAIPSGRIDGQCRINVSAIHQRTRLRRGMADVFEYKIARIRTFLNQKRRFAAAVIIYDGESDVPHFHRRGKREHQHNQKREGHHHPRHTRVSEKLTELFL